MSTATDFDTLGQLGSSTPKKRQRPRSQGAGSSARRRRASSRPIPVKALVGGAVGLFLLLAWGVASLAGSQTAVLSTTFATTPAVDPSLEATLATGEQPQIATGRVALVPGGGSAESTVEAPRAFAAFDDLAVHLPGVGDRPVRFVEADSAAALPLAPVGTLVENRNPTGFSEVTALPGPDYVVEAPSSGARPATGMAIVPADPGVQVTTPVRGSVVAVEQDPETASWRVVLAPAGRTDLHVVVRGLGDVVVAPGDATTVGLTPLGSVAAPAEGVDAGVRITLQPQTVSL